jgi:hypothetical protein
VTLPTLSLRQVGHFNGTDQVNTKFEFSPCKKDERESELNLATACQLQGVSVRVSCAK